MIRILVFLAALFALAPTQAHAQASVVIWCYNGATPNITVPCSTTTPLPVSASVSASIAGFPTSQSTGTPIAVTTGGVSGTLPTGTVVVATNVGATNGAYCKLGASATTSDQFIAPNGGWFAFTVGVNTQLTCITSTSTTTVNMVGGTGLPTGTGGGSGGGSSSNASVSTTGATVPASATYIGIISGGNLTGWTGAVTQGTAANLNATVVGTGTFAVQATQSGTWNVANTGTFAVQAALTSTPTIAIGKVDPNTIGSWGLQVSTQNSAAPTNGQLALAQFNTSPTTITAGNVSPLQMDNAGNLLVNIKAGAGSGGTAIADNSAFTTGTTNETPIGCYNGTPTTTSNHVGIVSCNGSGAINATIANSAPGTYGSNPGAVAALNVNAFITNTTTPGQATGAASLPVVPPSDYFGNFPIANAVFGTTSSMTGTTSTQLLAAVTSKIIYAMNISCVNSSTTGTLVTVQDGSGGTTLGTLTAAPSFGGDEKTNSTFPLFKTTSGNGLYVANVTTSAAVICTASGVHS